MPLTTGPIQLGNGYATLIVTQDDYTGDGLQDLKFNITLNGAAGTGDIRAFYLDLPTIYDGILSQLRLFATAVTDLNGSSPTLNSSTSVSDNGVITAYQASLDGVTNVGGGNIQGTPVDPNVDPDTGFGGSFDLGAAIGTPGASPDQITSVTLMLTTDPDSTGSLGLGTSDVLLNQFFGEASALRITSVEKYDPLNPNQGDDSLKLAGEIPAPLLPQPIEEETVCFDGLSHGFWKTHPGDWKIAGDTATAIVSTNGSNFELVGTQSYEQLFGLDTPSNKIKWSEFGGKSAQTYSDINLSKALSITGGGQNALAREATAALLNAANEGDELVAGAEYRFESAEIIAAVRQVYGLDDGITGNDNQYNATLGASLQQILEHWNTVHDELTYDPEHGFCVPVSQANASLQDLLLA